MAHTGPLRSGRGITTSESVDRGPRCGHCAEWVAVTTIDANGVASCINCRPNLYIDEIIRPVEAPKYEEVEE